MMLNIRNEWVEMINIMINTMYILVILTIAFAIRIILYSHKGRFRHYKVSFSLNTILSEPFFNIFFCKIKYWKKVKLSIEADREIYEAISFMRNIISLNRDKQVSSDYIIENLSQKEGVLQEIYIKMLSLLRINKKKDAEMVLIEKLETPIGKEFGGLLIKWDDIMPAELSEILLSHQKSIKEMNLTKQRRRDETISDILYFPVIINVVLIFINFIYVGYFIDQKELLQVMF